MFRQNFEPGGSEQGADVNMIEIEQYVDRLFKANRKEDYSADIPIIGGHYLPKEDNIRPLKKKACAALAAREWFYENGPAYAQPLPLSYNEREDLKSGGVPHILAWYDADTVTGWCAEMAWN
jgi:hypothetical protein